MQFARKCLYDDHSVLPTVADGHDYKVVGNLIEFTEIVSEKISVLQ